MKRLLPGFISRHFIEGLWPSWLKYPCGSNCRDSYPGTSLRGREKHPQGSAQRNCRDSYPGTSLRVRVADSSPGTQETLPGFISRHFIEGRISPRRNSRVRALPGFISRHFIEGLTDSQPPTRDTAYCRDSYPGTSLRAVALCGGQTTTTHCRDSYPGTSLRAAACTRA